MKLTNDLDMDLRTLTALMDLNHVFVLVDTNTQIHCLPILQKTLPIGPEHVYVMPAGEEHKNLQTVMHVWDWLIQQGATRKSLIINLGGGVVTDLGGFAASTFKRGVPYVNIPTTLLAMVDAGVGGKTGIDYQGLKNEIGLFSPSLETLVCVDFLKTLPSQELLSGFAEMVKHAYISSPIEVAEVLSFDIEQLGKDETQWMQLQELVRRSFEIKNYIVDCDPTEQGMRQTLNLGHTVGHALESFWLEAKDTQLPHGYAVMYGMVSELYLSVKKEGFAERDLTKLIHLMKTLYGKPVCACKDYQPLIERMHHDKKNSSSDTITCTLLRQIGNYRLGCQITDDEMCEALDFLMNC